mgnify:CR=1 FL=1
MAASREKVLEMRHVRWLVHLDRKRIARSLRGDARIDGDILGDLFLNLVAFGRQDPALVDERLPLGVGESSLAKLALDGIAARRYLGYREGRVRAHELLVEAAAGVGGDHLVHGLVLRPVRHRELVDAVDTVVRLAARGERVEPADGRDAGWRNAPCPEEKVDLVGSEVHHGAASVLVEPAPVEILLRVRIAILREDGLLRRTLHGKERRERAVPLRICRGHAAEHVRDDMLEAVAVAGI